MRYASIRDMDIVNGVGIACSLFVQGCSHHCKNCFNQETWDFNGGKEWTKEIEDEFIEICKRPYIDCVSILGGEPLDQDLDMLELLRRIKKEVGKPIYLWTGYTWETIFSNEDYVLEMLILSLCDYVIDGEYIDNLKDYRLKLRGSSNQRIIDVKKTLDSKTNDIKNYHKIVVIK